jgi:hypothetical protein
MLDIFSILKGKRKRLVAVCDISKIQSGERLLYEIKVRNAISNGTQQAVPIGRKDHISLLINGAKEV